MLVHVQIDGVESALALSEFEDLVRAGRVGPETPVRTDAAGWVAAHDLALYRDIVESPHMAVRRAWARPAIPWMTAIIVGVLVRIHLWGRSEEAIDRWAKWSPAILEQGEFWRLVTYAGLHGSFAHVAMNLLFLAYVGAALESMLGAVTVGLLFLVSVVGGGVLSAAVASNVTPAIGASAGDFGFLAAAVVLGWRHADVLPERAGPRFGCFMYFYLVWGLLNGVFSPAVDNLAHFGGLIAGGAYAAMLRPAVSPAWKARNRVAHALALVAVVAGLGGALLAPLPVVPATADGLTSSRPSWWADGWTTAGERGWVSPTNDGAAVARTARQDTPARLEGVTDALVESYTTIDPAATVRDRRTITQGDAIGVRLTLAYTSGDRARVVDAAVLVRGVYSHLVLLDRAASAPRLERLVAPVVDGARLGTLPAELELDPGDDTVSGLLHRARVTAEIGRLTEALSLVDAATRAAPGEPAPVQVGVELAATWGLADAGARAEAALVAFPEDRAILVAAVRALVASGQKERAREVIALAIAAAPGDRRLLRVERELRE